MLEPKSAKFGARLRKLLKAAGKPVPEVAKACGVSNSAVYGWFSTGRVGKDKLPTIAGLVGISTDELLDETGKRRPAFESNISPAASKLATLFDHLDDAERRAAWPWLVRMLATSPALLRTFLQYPAANAKVRKAYGVAGENAKTQK